MDELPITAAVPLRLAILGGASVGKTALAVRYLTRRYIGEYSSEQDCYYRQSTDLDGAKIDVDILDSSRCSNSCLQEHVTWADACIIVYTIIDWESFLEARRQLAQVVQLQETGFRMPVLILGNQRDLEHLRQVPAEDGQELSLRWGCQFMEVSAAAGWAGVLLAFQTVLRLSRSNHVMRSMQPLTFNSSVSLPNYKSSSGSSSSSKVSSTLLKRRLSVTSALSQFFNKASSHSKRNNKRPSLSI